MEVLKFKTLVGGVEKTKFYPVSTVVSIGYTKSSQGAESLVIQFTTTREIISNPKDVKEALSILKDVELNKHTFKAEQKAKVDAEKAKADLIVEEKKKAAAAIKAKEDAEKARLAKIEKLAKAKEAHQKKLAKEALERKEARQAAADVPLVRTPRKKKTKKKSTKKRTSKKI